MTRRYTSEIINEIGPEKDIPAPDVGTTPAVMAWIFDTYSMNKGHSVLGVVTGKPLNVGGSLGRLEATAHGALYCLREAAKKQGSSPAIFVSPCGVRTTRELNRPLRAGGRRDGRRSRTRASGSHPTGIDVQLRSRTRLRPPARMIERPIRHERRAANDDADCCSVRACSDHFDNAEQSGELIVEGPWPDDADCGRNPRDRGIMCFRRARQRRRRRSPYFNGCRDARSTLKERSQPDAE